MAYNGHIGEWTKASIQQRRIYVEFLLESLEHRDTEIRFMNARRLFYVLQGSSISLLTESLFIFETKPGTFSETVSPEHQLHWIFENCRVVRAANGVNVIVEALKIANHKHDLLWYLFLLSTFTASYGLSSYSNLTDQDAKHLRITLQEKSDLTEEVLTEVSVFFGMLYHLIEIFKGYDDFADELSEYFIIAIQCNSYLPNPKVSLDPPLPVYLFNLVSSLRDRTAKGYPIKKVPSPTCYIQI